MLINILLEKQGNTTHKLKIDSKGLIAIRDAHLSGVRHIMYYFEHKVRVPQGDTYVVCIPYDGEDIVYQQYQTNSFALLKESADWGIVPYCNMVVNTRKVKVIEVGKNAMLREILFGIERQDQSLQVLDVLNVSCYSNIEDRDTLATDLFKKLELQNKTGNWQLQNYLMYRSDDLQQIMCTSKPDKDPEFQLSIYRERGHGCVVYP